MVRLYGGGTLSLRTFATAPTRRAPEHPRGAVSSLRGKVKSGVQLPHTRGGSALAAGSLLWQRSITDMG